jgi:hypothetical protein
LQDQVPPRMRGEFGTLKDGPEVSYVAMHVAGHEDVVGVLRANQSPRSARRIPERLNRTTNR